MDCTAAAHRLEIGLTAIEEHKGSDGAEATQWVAETTQVGSFSLPSSRTKLMTSHHADVHYHYGRAQAESTSQRSAPSLAIGTDEQLYAIQGFERMGRTAKVAALVRFGCLSIICRLCRY